MQIDFTPDPALYPFTSRWFDSSQGRMHYVDEGSGPVIMFFHGNPTWSFLYRGIIAGLREEPMGGILIESAPGSLHLHREQVRRIESRRDREQALQAAQQQSRAHKQHEGERDLRDDECAARQLAPTGGMP